MWLCCALQLWNYSKTPARGVRDIEVFVDDVLIYSGVLKRAPPASTGRDSTSGALSPTAAKLSAAGGSRHRFAGSPSTLPPAADFGQAILFTNDAAIVNTEQHRVYNPDEDEEVWVVVLVWLGPVRVVLSRWGVLCAAGWPRVHQRERDAAAVIHGL